MRSLCTFGLLALLLLGNSSHARAIDIVANSNVPQHELSLRELRAIFSMQLRRWSDGNPITVLVLKNSHPTHNNFCKDLLRVFPHQLQNGWDRLVFSGTGVAPLTVNSEAEMLQLLTSTPGAIGYLEQVTEHDELQTLPLR